MKLDFKNIKYTALTSKAVSSKYKPYVLPAVVVAISVIVLLLVFRPKLNEILALKEEVKQEKQRLEAIKTKVTELVALDPVDLEEDLKLVNRALPFEKDVPSAIIGLERLAAESGLIIESLALAPGGVSTDSAKLDSSTELEIKLSFRGPFQAIKDYTKKVRDSLRIFGIKDAVIVAPGSEDPSNLALSTNVIIYFSPLPKSRGNVETPLPKITEEEKELMNKITNYQFVSNVPSSTASSKPDPFAGF